MTTSSYMPNVVVEIAFASGYGTPAASRVSWVDVSDYLDLEATLSISVGRGDERSFADANRLTLVLDNRDGRFTPERVTSPYYPNVKLDRPIRVTATPVDGSASVRFLGFVNEWPVEWEGSDGYARVTISASSRLARLGQVSAFTSIIEEAILANSPLVYYTLGEPVGATQANDSSGNLADPLVLAGNPALPVVFGNATGPGTDSLTAAQFAGGQFLLGGPVNLGAATSFTVEFFALRTNTPAQEEVLVAWSTSNGGSTYSITVDNGAGRLAFWENVTKSTTSGTIADGRVHHVALVFAGFGFTAYLDGAVVGSGGSGHTLTISDVRVGAPAIPGNPLTGSVSHVAITAGSLSTGQIAAHANAGLTGYAGETTSARLARYAGYAGVPSDEIAAETGQVTVQHVDTSSKQPVELMRLMETTEGGVLFDDRTGALTFHNRAHRVTAASAFTLDMTQHMVEAGYSPKLDRSTLLNDITGADVSGKFTARVFDATSRTDYGVATSSVETASDSPSEPMFLASWMLYKYKTPKSRVADLSVDALAQVGKTPNCATVMAANVGTKVTVAGHPQQAAYSSVDYFIEGYTETYGPESLRFTFNVSPSSPDDLTFVVDDPSRGVVDTNPVAL